MTIQDYIELVRRGVWEATADAGGPTSGVDLTIYTDENGAVVQEEKKVCIIKAHVHYSKAFVQAILQESQSESD